MAYISLHKANSNHRTRNADGSMASRYSRYEIGVIDGQHREIMAVIADQAGFDGMGFDASIGSGDDNWHVANVFTSDRRYVDTIVIGGADDAEHAAAVAQTQLDHLGGDNCVVLANPQFDSLTGDKPNTWSLNSIEKLLSNPSQNKTFLPVITAQELNVEAARVTFDTVQWDSMDGLVSHKGNDSALYLDMVRADGHNQLLEPLNLVHELGLLGAEETSFDALMDTKNRLSLMKDRLFNAMSRSGDSDLSVTNVTETKPFKRQGVTNIAFVFDLSDGQKLSIWFHNPDSTPSKLMPSDIMISWKWMLNKRDVTAILSPKQGDNVQIPVLAARIMRVARKNSKKFAATQARAAELEKELQDAQTLVEVKQGEIDQLDTDISGLNAAIDAAMAKKAEEPTTPPEATAKEQKEQRDRERVLAMQFDEVTQFYKNNGAEPNRYADDIIEKMLAKRLESIRANAEFVEYLAPYDTYNLLNDEPAPDVLSNSANNEVPPFSVGDPVVWRNDGGEMKGIYKSYNATNHSIAIDTDDGQMNAPANEVSIDHNSEAAAPQIGNFKVGDAVVWRNEIGEMKGTFRGMVGQNIFIMTDDGQMGAPATEVFADDSAPARVSVPAMTENKIEKLKTKMEDINDFYEKTDKAPSITSMLTSERILAEWLDEFRAADEAVLAIVRPLDTYGLIDGSFKERAAPKATPAVKNAHYFSSDEDFQALVRRYGLDPSKDDADSFERNDDFNSTFWLRLYADSVTASYMIGTDYNGSTSRPLSSFDDFVITSSLLFGDYKANRERMAEKAANAAAPKKPAAPMWWESLDDNVSVYLVGRSRKKDNVRFFKEKNGDFTASVAVGGVGGASKTGSLYQAINYVLMRTQTMGGKQMALRLVKGDDVMSDAYQAANDASRAPEAAPFIDTVTARLMTTYANEADETLFKVFFRDGKYVLEGDAVGTSQIIVEGMPQLYEALNNIKDKHPTMYAISGEDFLKDNVGSAEDYKLDGDNGEKISYSEIVRSTKLLNEYGSSIKSLIAERTESVTDFLVEKLGWMEVSALLGTTYSGRDEFTKNGHVVEASIEKNPSPNGFDGNQQYNDVIVWHFTTSDWAHEDRLEVSDSDMARIINKAANGKVTKPDALDEDVHLSLFLERNKDKAFVLGFGANDVEATATGNRYDILEGVFAGMSLRYADTVCKLVDAAQALGAKIAIADFDSTAYQNSMFDALTSQSQPIYGITAQIEKDGVIMRASVNENGDCQILVGSSGDSSYTAIGFSTAQNSAEFVAALKGAFNYASDTKKEAENMKNTVQSNSANEPKTYPPVEYLGEGRYRAYKDASKKEYWTASRINGVSKNPFAVTANFEGGVTEENKSKTYKWDEELIAAYPAFQSIKNIHKLVGVSEEDWPLFTELDNDRYRAYKDASKKDHWTMSYDEYGQYWVIDPNFDSDLDRGFKFSDINDLLQSYPEFAGVDKVIKAKADAAKAENGSAYKRADSYDNDAWNKNRKPNAREQLIIDAVKQALDEGVNASYAIQERAAEILNVSQEDIKFRAEITANRKGEFNTDIREAINYIERSATPTNSSDDSSDLSKQLADFEATVNAADFNPANFDNDAFMALIDAADGNDALSARIDAIGSRYEQELIKVSLAALTSLTGGA